MKKVIFTTLLFSHMAFIAFAQTPAATVKGLVIDSLTSSPLSYISVSLIDPVSNKPVKSMQSSENGNFEFDGIPFASYQLNISEVGYKTKIIALRVSAAQSIIDMGNINLSPSATQLKEVSVTGKKDVVKQEVDRITYNVQADPDNKALDMLEMMRKVPLLSVDGNNNIQLKGGSNYKVLIDGKESAMMANNPSDVLQAMPASDIQSIEVITTPPAKYDAEGLSGIINIITKKRKLQGYNVNLNGRANSANGANINSTTNIQDGKIGATIRAGFVDNTQYTTGFGTRQIFLTDQRSLTQNGTHFGPGDVGYTVAQLSYEIDSLNLVTVSGSFYKEGQNLGGSQSLSQFAGAGALLQQYNLNTTGNTGQVTLETAINYQMGFKRSKDQLLTLSYDYVYSPYHNFTTNIFNDQFNFSQPGYEQFNSSHIQMQTAQVDYVQPVKKLLQIEAGAKGIFRDYRIDFNSALQNTAGGYTTDPAESINSDYAQNVYSLYNSYQAKAGDWTIKAGWRFEYTGINANFISTANTTLNIGYHNLIPSVALQRKFKHSSINFGYTDRIQRPGIGQLNSFIEVINPAFIRFGNPALKPQLNHTFELNYSHIDQNSFITGISYAFSNNAIQNVSYRAVEVINNQPDTVTASTFQNLGSNRTLNYNFSTSLNLTRQFSLNINGQVSRVWLQGAYNDLPYSNSGYTESAFAGPSFLLNSGYRFSFNFSYNSGSINLEGRNGYNLSSLFLVSKTFFNQKLSLTAVASNPWSRYKNTNSYTNTPDFTQTSYNQNIYRSFSFRFYYNFGKLKTEIKKTKVGIVNDDLK